MTRRSVLNQMLQVGRHMLACTCMHLAIGFLRQRHRLATSHGDCHGRTQAEAGLAKATPFLVQQTLVQRSAPSLHRDCTEDPRRRLGKRLFAVCYKPGGNPAS